MGWKIDNLCMGCMTLKADGENVCPHCGFQEDVYDIAPHHLHPRTILTGKYLVGKVLGEGGFGITYIGWDLNLELKIAIKEYYPDGFVTRDTTTADTVTAYAGEKTGFYEKGRENFVEEARRLAKFYALPGIVSVKDFFLENETAYIVMEYVDGMTMKRALDEAGGKMPEARVLEMMKPLMNSLAEIHKAGIVHRDISPDNIMITKQGSVKLLDFGAAREFSAGTETQTVLLKPGYAPEEQYSTHSEQDSRTDIYALCATIYRAIEGKTPPEAPQRLRQDTLTGLSVQVSPRTEYALLKGMSLLRQDRWQSVPELAGELYHDLPRPPVIHTLIQKITGAFKNMPYFLARKKKLVLTCLGAACLVLVTFFAGWRLWGAGAVPVAAPEPSVPESSQAVVSVAAPSSSEAPQVDPSAINWNDAELEKMIRKALKKPTGVIRQEDLEGITKLTIRGQDIFVGEIVETPEGDGPEEDEPRGGIVSLEDLRNFVNLQLLIISRQQVSDVSPLADLTGLVGLSLYDNRISDITPLAGLPALKRLDLGNNQIKDLSPLAGFGALEAVGLLDNPVDDWSPVEHIKTVEGKPETPAAPVSSSSSQAPPPSSSKAPASSSSKEPASSSSEESSSQPEVSQEEEATYVEDYTFVFKTRKFSVKGKYSGKWKNGMPNGYGTMVMTQDVAPFWEPGDILAGEWVDGLLNGYGEYYGVGGYSYQGNFVDGLKHGKGTMKGNNGEVWTGKWRSGDFIG